MHGKSASDDHAVELKRPENMKPYLLALVSLIILTQTATATGPAGSTGAVATIPGTIVRWQPGDPVPPGLLSVMALPIQSQKSPHPPHRATGIRRR
jgi:hypothetical protein